MEREFSALTSEELDHATRTAKGLTMNARHVSEGRMLLPPCPHLPTPRPEMDFRVYAPYGESRGAGFYGAALEYGNYLWQHHLPARAILCLDRAMGAEVGPSDAVVGSWPMPYAAMAWLLREVPRDLFCGNPRVHFQHYADRMNEPRKVIRTWRSWACWAITRHVRPELPADPRHAVREPTLSEIGAALDAHGLPGERGLWQAQLSR